MSTTGVYAYADREIFAILIWFLSTGTGVFKSSIRFLLTGTGILKSYSGFLSTGTGFQLSTRILVLKAKKVPVPVPA